jgi:AcrR family transcriptional regulator
MAFNQPTGVRMSPRSAAQFEELRADAKDRLERAALNVFGRGAMRPPACATSPGRPASRRGLLYNYYRGKQDLLAAVFRRCLADVRTSFAAAAVDAPPAERLARLVRAAFAVVREHLSFWQTGLRHPPTARRRNRPRPELRAWTEEIRATLEQQLCAAGHAEAGLQARLLFAAIDGVAQHFALDPAGYPLDAVAERVVATFATCAPFATYPARAAGPERRTPATRKAPSRP